MDSKQWLALKASAGSGKTFALAMRYISLLLRGANPNEILTLTFTKKAASEMKKRINENLITLKNGYNAQILIAELKNYGVSEEKIQKNIVQIHQNFLRANTKIMTIDSFLNFILKKFCWYVGVSNRYKIEFEDKEKIYEDFLQSLTENDFKDFLNFCIFKDFNPKTLLDLIFRLDLGHFKLQDYLQELKDVPKDFEILNAAQKIKNIICLNEKASDRAKNAIKTENIKELTKNLKWLEEKSDYHYFKKLQLESLNPEFEALQESLKKYFDYQEQLFFKQLLKFLKLYKKSRKNTTNALSFDSITLKTYELLQNHFERDFFYFRLDDKITHILIDEFQDTSTIQYKILKPLIDEIYAGEGRFEDRSIFFVGDTKQSIYRFRGSNSQLFDEASKHIEQKNLEYNYRSSESVISYVNQIFEPKIASYVPQKFPPNKNASTKGYVKICQAQEDIFKEVLKNLEILLEHNIPAEKIAILCFGNDDVLNLKDYLLSQNAKLQIITEANMKLTHQNESKIILHSIAFSKTNLEIHKKSALKLAGLELETNIEMPVQTPSKTPQKFILEVMETFGLYGKAAQKMLEISFDYENLDDFINSIERLEIDFAPEFKKGLQIMTIHKSKGLEFEYVILCDRIKSQKPDTNKLIFEYAGIDLKKIFFKQQEREKTDPVYKNALDKEKELQEKEKINVLYVAFTRAKEGLVVIFQEQKSAFKELDLSPCEFGNLQNLPHQKSEEIKIAPIVVEQKKFGKQEDFIKQDENPQAPIQLDLLFGEALHKALEYGLGYGIKNENILQILNNQFGYHLPQTSITHILDLIGNLKKNDMFKTIISEGLVKSEVSYLYHNALNRIDGIVLDKNGTIIVLDYKSGIKDKEKHKEQVKKYLEFSKTQFGQSQIKAYILYVREKIEFIPVT